MATRIILWFILAASSLTLPILSLPSPVVIRGDKHLSSYIQFKRADDHRYRPSLVSFLHRQPDGSQLPTIRYYRIVFHCNIFPGSLYLRFSNVKPFRTVVQNRQDPATIFAFRSVGAYSRVQIQSHLSGQWLCMNQHGRIVPRINITIDNLACTFRQNSDGPYMNLVSEFDSSRQITFSTLHLLSMNPILHQRYEQLTKGENPMFKPEQCSRFMLDSQIDINLLNRTTNPFFRSRH